MSVSGASAQATFPMNINSTFPVGAPGNMAGTADGPDADATLPALGLNQGVACGFTGTLNGTDR